MKSRLLFLCNDQGMQALARLDASACDVFAALSRKLWGGAG
jgi:hypothetical protein